MQLQENHQDVVCISLNLDHKDPASPPTEELQTEIVTMLQGMNISCVNVIASDGHDNVLAHYNLTNGLPAVMIYDREGQLRKSRDAGFEYDTDIEPVIAELLAG